MQGDTFPTPASAETTHEPGAPETRRPYRRPQLRSTDAFERMALLSCGDDASQPEECAEL